LTHVDKSEAPTPDQAGSWYRYVIEGGYAPIIGHRRGTQKQIREYAERYADELNERRRFGMPSLVGRPRKQN
jgi:hypothetical protein